MKTQLMKLTMVALTGFAFLTPSAKASLTYNDGDLFLGFQAATTATQGATTSYVIDIGSITNFIGSGTYAGSGIHNLSISGVALDLAATYGSAWSSNATTGLMFGVIGTDYYGSVVGSGQTLFASKPETTNGVQSASPWSGASLGAQDGVGNTILNEFGAMYGSQNPTANNPAGTIQTNSVATQGDWAYYMPSATVTSTFGYFGGTIEAVLTGAANVVDLYQLNVDGGAGTLLGAFRITSNGTIQFSQNVSNFSSVPEPSTYALFGGGLIALVLLRRAYRKKDQVTA